MRTGAEYLKSLDDGRQVYFDGAAVERVAEHPAFAGVAKTIARMYDVAADPANGMQAEDPTTGATVNRIWLPPRTPEELTLRRRAHERWAEVSRGWTGRSPDHVGSFFTAFAAHPEVFARGVRDCGDAVRALSRRVVEEDLYLAYAIIPPKVQIGGAPDDFIQVGVIEEQEDGIIVRGSQFLATGAAIADEIFVSCIKPLKDEDADFAVSFVVAPNTPGLKLLNRRPFAPQSSSAFDYPLTSQFDEPDSVLVFDDVFIPWERVLASRDVRTVRDQFFATGAHVIGNWQAQIRFTTKLTFIASVAHRLAEVNGALKDPAVRGKLGELASLVSLVDSAVLAAEHTAEPDESGLMLPGRRSLYGVMGLQSELYPRVISIVRELAGSAVLQPPATVNDLTSDVTSEDIYHYVTSPGATVDERVQLFKLAWDIVGTEFAGRHQQYEILYAGAPALVRGVYTFNNFGFDQLSTSLDEFLATLPSPHETETR